VCRLPSSNTFPLAAFFIVPIVSGVPHTMPPAPRKIPPRARQGLRFGSVVRVVAVTRSRGHLRRRRVKWNLFDSRPLFHLTRRLLRWLRAPIGFASAKSVSERLCKTQRQGGGASTPTSRPRGPRRPWVALCDRAGVRRGGWSGVVGAGQARIGRGKLRQARNVAAVSRLRQSPHHPPPLPLEGLQWLTAMPPLHRPTHGKPARSG